MWRALWLMVGCLVLPGLTWSSHAVADCAPVVLAPFDVGSGTTRMRVVELWPCEALRWETLLTEEAAIPFAADLLETGNGAFSPAVREQATRIMAGLVIRARAHGAQALPGVATQAFRRAADAAELLAEWREQFGLDIEIISQETEGRLAYRLMEARRASPSSLVVWDIGAGSQQLVWRDPEHGSLRHFNSTLASVSFRRLVMSHLGRPHAAVSPNPINRAEADALLVLIGELVRAEIPDALRRQIAAGAEVIGVGGVHGSSLIQQAGLESGAMLTRPLLERTLAAQLDKDDAAIGGAYASTDVTNLILVLGLMDAFGVEAYEATRHDLTEALLVDWLDRLHPGSVPLVRSQDVERP